MHEDFHTLVDELGSVAEFEWLERDASDEHGPFVRLCIEDVEFALRPAPFHPGVLSVYCNFGPLGDGDRASDVVRLLEVNLALAEVGPCVLGLDAETEEVICVFKLSMRQLEGRALLAELKQAAVQATAWRTSRFDPPAIPTVRTEPELLASRA
jgi:hypothetical protein